LKPASTPSSPSADPSLCSGRSLDRPSRAFCGGRLLRRALLASCAATALATYSIPQQPSQRATARRVNELTLAGLRPGRASAKHAIRLLGEPAGNAEPDYSNHLDWFDHCRGLLLTVDLDKQNRIPTVRLSRQTPIGEACDVRTSPWKTGHGLRVYDETSLLQRTYGNPDSKSPSTRDGQPLELWYYAFDWAGPDVPQVMEILCTREKEGQPGRVVEITLAAPSL